MKRWITVMVVTVCFLLLLASQLLGGIDNKPEVVIGPWGSNIPSWVPSDFKVAKVQIFPEGCMGYGFETWMAICNAGDKEASVIIRAMGDSVYYQTNAFKVAPHQRITLDMDTFISSPESMLQANPGVSFEMLSTSSDVCAQESMYWNNRAGGFTSTGVERKGE
jgi:hypothetical protein